MGHVWQGRFKCPVVQNDAHALVVPRYLEANPLRARMVADLASYPWSSYRAHGMGGPDPLLSPLPRWEGQVGAATAGVLAAMGAHPTVGPRLSCRAPVGGERAALWRGSVDSRRGVRLGIASGATAPWPAAETAGKMNCSEITARK
jgi:hypothetical protein